MAKDYYLILGVPLDAAPDEIRSAFRKMALRHHPDRQRESSPRRFQDISEAYGVLSDPFQRARYDHELRRLQERRAAAHATSRMHDPEPLISEPMPLEGMPEAVSPSLEALFDHLRRNFSNLETPEAERAEPLNFELILSPEEARQGVLVPFQVPLFLTCIRCGGMGREWLFPCEECGGEGRIIKRDAVHVRVPAGVRDGSVIELSLARLGIHNLWLRVHVRVGMH
jgi:molecular chaperone DnaJ